MQKDHQIPNLEKDDLELIAAMKSLSSTQKQIILDKIESIQKLSNDSEINSSLNMIKLMDMNKKKD